MGNIFNVKQISITDVLNCEIEVYDYESGVTTSQGKDRCVLKIKFQGEDCKFFTNSRLIKETLSKIPKNSFPFLTTIKAKKLGSGNSRMYYLS